MDTDYKLAHHNARINSDRRQKIVGLRHAAQTLRCTLPTGTVARATVEAVIARLEADARTLETS